MDSLVFTFSTVITILYSLHLLSAMAGTSNAAFARSCAVAVSWRQASDDGFDSSCEVESGPGSCLVLSVWFDCCGATVFKSGSLFVSSFEMLMVIFNFPSSSFEYRHSGLKDVGLTQADVITCPFSFSFPTKTTSFSAFVPHFKQSENVHVVKYC